MKITYLDNETITITASEPWNLVNSHQFKRASLSTNQRGRSLSISVRSSLPASLIVLCHPWSGICKIAYDNGKEEHIDLFDNLYDGNLREIPILCDSTVKTFTLECSGDRNASSRDSQIWLLGFKLGERFFPIERGLALSPTVRLIDGEYGRFMTLRSDIGVAESLANEGVWARKDIDLFKTHVPEGGYVLDVGANFGHHSIVFSKLVGPMGKVIAFEPQKMMFCLLSANLAINNAMNVDPYRLGVGERSEILQMYPIDYGSDNNFGALGVDAKRASVGNSSGGEEIPVVSLDSFISGLGAFERFDFIKIDVQSFELFVLKGATMLLSRFRPTVFIEISPKWMNRRGYCYKEIYALLASLDYHFVHFGAVSDATLIPEWDGISDEEWDVLAVCDRRN
jgi:FkbM family methyltransferase